MGCALAVVNRKLGTLAVLAFTAEDEQGADKKKTDQNEDQESNDEVDHRGRQSTIIVVPTDKLVEEMHRVEWYGVFSCCCFVVVVDTDGSSGFFYTATMEVLASRVSIGQESKSF